MNSNDVLAVSNFRRFAIMCLYPNIASMLMKDIQNTFNSDILQYDIDPQAIIKFNYNTKTTDNTYEFLVDVHSKLSNIFVKNFNNPEIVKLFRKSLFNYQIDQSDKDLINNVFTQIQLNNNKFIGLLFNVVVAADDLIYIYL